MTAQARFKQADFERIFKAAKKADVRVAGKVTPAGEIEFRMLTEGEINEADWRDGSPLYDGGHGEA